MEGAGEIPQSGAEHEPAAALEGGCLRIRVEKAGARSRALREGALLMVSAAVLGLSFSMQALESRGLWPDVPCLFRKVTGLPCLTCGLTRSFSLAARGALGDAFRMHLLGPVLFMALFPFTAYLAVTLATGRRIRIRLSPHLGRALSRSILALLLVLWAVKLICFRAYW